MADPCARFTHVEKPPQDGSGLQGDDSVLTGNSQTGGAETFWTPPFGTRQIEDED